MFSDTIFTSMRTIIDSYINYLQEDDPLYYDSMIEIITNMWIVLFKSGNTYDPNKIDKYRIMAVNSYKSAQCKKLICGCNNNDYCDKCIQFNKTLRMIELEEEMNNLK